MTGVVPPGAAVRTGDSGGGYEPGGQVRGFPVVYEAAHAGAGDGSFYVVAAVEIGGAADLELEGGGVLVVVVVDDDGGGVFWFSVFFVGFERGVFFVGFERGVFVVGGFGGYLFFIGLCVGG